ncbi:tetratricopeptide repeat protein [Crocinitomix catalasitica]|nr:tetratricopeptide repeat protein [Crocinitomix catalasitica]
MTLIEIRMGRYFNCLLVIFFLASCGNNETTDTTDSNSNDIDSTKAVDSLDLFDNQVKKYPNQTEPLFQRAKYFIRQGSFESAEGDLERALAMDSTVLKVRNLYADILMSKLELEEGKRHYEYVLEKDSANTDALLGLGKLYALLDNSAQAIYHLSVLLQIDPHHAEAYFMKGMIYRSDFYETGRQESWDRAMSSYQTAVEQDPNYYAAFVEMGVMHDQIDSDLALDYYNSALDIYPESIEAWYNIGMYYQTRGEVDKAIETYSQLHRIDSTYADGYFNHGYIHMIMTEDIDSAIFFFNTAVEIDPEYFQAFNNLGLCYEKKKDIERARQYYQKAIEINPNYQLAKDNLNALQ